ncbi:amidohydrolase family protein [Novosphingobium terrae]|uniref:amidohydrolase family protein n=1 Tax=Novosphingobium terrae TaxID=2726189 RepID=UPI00197EBA87|nr:amidohydrolase family protein [Novosphingobium terrae]
MVRIKRLGLHVACAALALGTASGACAQRIVLDNATIVDTRTGKLTPHRAVVVEGNRIASIAAAGTVKAAPGDQRIDASGKFVVPGYNDMHAHPLNPGDTANQLQMMLAMGITGFRQMSGSPELLAARKAGTLMPKLAPTLLVTPGSLLVGPNAATPEMAVAEVHRQKAQGADFIKAISLPPAVLFAAHAAAKADGLTVTGHLLPLVNPREAAEHGMDGIEHLGPGDALLLGCSSQESALRAAIVPPRPVVAPPAEGEAPKNGAGTPPPGVPGAIGLANPLAFTPLPAILAYGKVLDSYDAGKCGALADVLAARGIWQTPTLIRVRTMEFGDDPAYVNNPELRYVIGTDRAVWQAAGERYKAVMTEPARAVLSRLFTAQLALTKLFYDHHVPMMAGDDTGGAGWVVPGYGLHQEFDLLTQAGLPPLAILQMTTLNPARYLHREASMGTVEAGKTADLLLLDGDPVASAANLHRIGAVLHDGHYYNAEDLAGLRAQVADREK